MALPPQPGVGPPGIISGRLVWQKPGRLLLEPARGASVFVLGTNLAATSNDDGRFLIEGLTNSDGVLFVRFDGDGDGVRERQRSLLLREVGAGRGRQISLGDVVLGQSAVVSGRVVRGDVTDPNDHFGTPAFVPGFPLAALTQADGAFLLEGLAQGSVQLAAVRTGYQPYLSGPLALRGGEELSLARIFLAREVAPSSGVLRGRVVDTAGEALSGVTVSTGGARTTTSDATGAWRFSGLSADRYDALFSASGRLPAALYSVLVGGPDEIVMPDVVLAQGQAMGAPSLVNEVSMEQGDAGSFDAGTRDSGMPPGDGGTDGGFDGGVMVSIGGLPLMIPLSGGNLSLAALVVPAPGAATYAWSATPPGVVMIGNPSTKNTGLTPQGPGAFRLNLDVTFGGITYSTFADSSVFDDTATVDSGFAMPLVVTDAGASALSIWVECEGPFRPPLNATVMLRGSPVPSSFAYDGVKKRLVAVFDEPRPLDTVVFSATGLQLIDGGLRDLSPVALFTDPLAFGAAVLLVDGGLQDFNAGATYRPNGLIATGRMFDGAGCNGCFVVHRESGLEASLQGDLGPAVPWRRANSAGTSVQAWFSTRSRSRRPASVTPGCWPFPPSIRARSTPMGPRCVL